MRRLLITPDLGASLRTTLARELVGIELRFNAEPSAIDIEWADAVFGSVPVALLLGAKDPPVWLHSPSVGLDSYEPVLEQRPEITITNAPGVMDDAVAEHAIAMLLALTRNLPTLVRAQAARLWHRENYIGSGRVTILARKRAHVLGYGPVARTLIDKLLGLGLRVTVYRRAAGVASGGVERVLPFSVLPTSLSEADIVIGILPAKLGTRGLIGRRELSALPDGAYLINVGRGSLIDEIALLENIEAGRLGGVALDVFGDEPLANDSPLWGFDNVIISPHVAGHFDNAMARHVEGYIQRFREVQP